MTEHEIELALELDGCGVTGHRFMRDMAFLARHKPEQELNLRQRHYMEILAWRYRRQLPGHLVPDQKPLDMPRKAKPPKVAKPKQRDLFVTADLFQ